MQIYSCTPCAEYYLQKKKLNAFELLRELTCQICTYVYKSRLKPKVLLAFNLIDHTTNIITSSKDNCKARFTIIII